MKCPTCRKPASVTQDNPFRPFCSERCKLVDLGRWASGTFRLPGEKISPEVEDSIERLNEPDPDEPN